MSSHHDASHDNDDDEELARAIAMSLATPPRPHVKPASPTDASTISDDNEQDELEQAIALSLQGKPHLPRKRTADVIVISDDDESPTTSSKTASTSSNITGFLADRAQLEKERLGRLRVRNREQECRERARKYRRTAGLDDDDAGSDGEVPSKPQPVITLRSTSATPTTEDLFFDGELRPTIVHTSQPRKDKKAVFTLPQVLGKKSDISFAILSSFVSEINWVRSHFDPSTPVVFVTHGENNTETATRRICPNWIEVTPKLGHMGCFHMKFMLIFYKTGRVRVVISTANLIRQDYGEMENLLWLQDIPPRPTPIECDSKSATKLDDFPSVLQRTLHAIGVKEALGQFPGMLPITAIEDLRCRWDWSKVNVQLVPSIAGKHTGVNSINAFGHTRLMKAVRNLGMTRKPGRIALECLSSSLGSYTTSWLNEFYNSALGQSASDYLSVKGARSKRPMMGSIDVVYPTKATVMGSTLGPMGASTICCQPKQWEGFRTLIRPDSKFHLRDSRSRGGNNLMHSKMILGLFQDQEDNAPIGWAYMGSHNFTPSAWGRVSGKGAADAAITINNYEIGIVFPIRELEKVTFWERPARRYGMGDEPWMGM